MYITQQLKKSSGHWKMIDPHGQHRHHKRPTWDSNYLVLFCCEVITSSILPWFANLDRNSTRSFIKSVHITGWTGRPNILLAKRRLHVNQASYFINVREHLIDREICRVGRINIKIHARNRCEFHRNSQHRKRSIWCDRMPNFIQILVGKLTCCWSLHMLFTCCWYFLFFL